MHQGEEGLPQQGPRGVARLQREPGEGSVHGRHLGHLPVVRLGELHVQGVLAGEHPELVGEGVEGAGGGGGPEEHRTLQVPRPEAPGVPADPHGLVGGLGQEVRGGTGQGHRDLVEVDHPSSLRDGALHPDLGLHLLLLPLAHRGRQGGQGGLGRRLLILLQESHQVTGVDVVGERLSQHLHLPQTHIVRDVPADEDNITLGPQDNSEPIETGEGVLRHDSSLLLH